MKRGVATAHRFSVFACRINGCGDSTKVLPCRGWRARTFYFLYSGGAYLTPRYVDSCAFLFDEPAITPSYLRRTTPPHTIAMRI